MLISVVSFILIVPFFFSTSFALKNFMETGTLVIIIHIFLLLSVLEFLVMNKCGDGFMTEFLCPMSVNSRRS